MASRTVKGKDLVISVNGVAILCANNVTFNSTYTMIDAACRESGGNADAEYGENSHTLEVSGWWKIDTPEDATQMRGITLAKLHKQKARVDWTFGTDVAGEEEFFGQCLIPDLTVNAPQKENADYSVTFQGVGEWDIRTIV
ncbi:hypothetical protein CLV24_11412 [Pontibacter ummariensis]|uniref:Phage tail tube protein n=1 Tax=Pontibacter ummariensis TaxID=1610492 RepID=A0A239HM99_9BACT|nr:hypothetical protein [Pontibacter ummariensis]PRY10284.1 hypothetical protein CLV24_11412 [Pontibacter ummariensis]SNS81384.1 hypothetical protein SAMN06296052_11412 [Pontibacter ummariensis]